MTKLEYEYYTEADRFSYICNRCLAEIDIDNGNFIDEDMTWAYSLHPIPQIDYNCFKRKDLHFTHLNIRSLLPKLSQLKLTIKDTNAAVLSFSETWLDDSISDNEVEIEGYNIVWLDRNREGGGVCIYVRDDIAFNVRNELTVDELEGIWIDILLPKTKPILIGLSLSVPSASVLLQVSFNFEAFSHKSLMELG